jgi:hypothetical protein
VRSNRNKANFLQVVVVIGDGLAIGLWVQTIRKG